MLKDIISHRSNQHTVGDETALLNQSKDTEKHKQGPSFRAGHSPDNHRQIMNGSGGTQGTAQTLNHPDKSTDVPGGKKLADGGPLEGLFAHANNQFDLESCRSLDLSLYADERPSERDRYPYAKSASKHMELTRKLFQRVLRRPTQGDFYFTANRSMVNSSAAFIVEVNESDQNPQVETHGVASDQ